MNEILALREEIGALERLMEAQVHKIETLKETLKKDVPAVSQELEVLRELSDEVSALRELRRLAALKKALLSREKPHSAATV